MRAINAINFDEIYIRSVQISPELPHWVAARWHGRRDGPYLYEKYLRRKTAHLHYEDFDTPAEICP
ncbi:MAG: hypothetical protein LC751_14450 [Actinobacteria bacterium]|nr:hypothetical protein [Actinomycetota bacterium]